MTAGTIREWTQSTTFALLQPTSNAYAILDHVFHMRFCDALKNELKVKNVMEKLRAAKTSMEVQENVMTSQIRSFLPSSESPPKSSNIRGDYATFVPRSHRSTSSFKTNYPQLHHLIDSIESTVSKNLGEKSSHGDGLNTFIEIDRSLTSVQVAMYPGDGVSGYTRHCDVGEFCEEENSANNCHQPKRVITAVYYVNDVDWSIDDGGCLRMFSSSQNEPYSDIIPYPDRMVIFRSNLVEHQVLPSSHRRRIAITVWLYGMVHHRHDVVSSRKTQDVILRDASGGILSSQAKDIIGKGTESSPPLVVNEIIRHESESTIFVSIASYRDSEIIPTINSIIENASLPHRIYVGLVFQSSNEEYDVFERSSSLPLPWANTNLRKIYLHYQDATGPCYARYLAQSLYRGEDYFLQIDSHMRFRKKWDSYLIRQLNRCPQPEKSILTTYPPGYSLPNIVPNITEGTLLVPWKFDSDNMLRQKGRILKSCSLKNQHLNDNIPTLLFAAGFNFSHSSMIEDCPYDLELHHLFFGEEISLALRLFTSGYDLFAPPETVCFHLWSRDHRKSFQGDIGTSQVESRDNADSSMSTWQQTSKAKSLAKIRSQLAGTDTKSIGKCRTVTEFASRLGVDFKKGIILLGSENGCLEDEDFLPTDKIGDDDQDEVMKHILSFLAS